MKSWPLWIFLALFSACAISTRAASPVAILPAAFKDAQQPQIATAADGAVHIVFGMDGTVYHVMSRDLTTFSSPVRIGALSKLALGMRRGPRIAISDRALIVTAQSHEDGDVHAWLSQDAGQIWKPLPNLNSVPGSAKEGLGALASHGATVAAAWLDARSGGAEIWSRVSLDGGLTWQAERLVYHSPEGHICECCTPSVAVNPEGRIAIMFRNYLLGSRDMHASTSSDGGRTFTPAVKLGSGTWKLNACPMDGGALAWSASTKPTAVWRRVSTVYLSDIQGPESVLANPAAQPVIAQSSQGKIIVWENQNNLILQRLADKPVVFATNARFATVAALPNARAAIAWESLAGGSVQLMFASVAMDGK